MKKLYKKLLLLSIFLGVIQANVHQPLTTLVKRNIQSSAGLKDAQSLLVHILDQHMRACRVTLITSLDSFSLRQVQSKVLPAVILKIVSDEATNALKEELETSGGIRETCRVLAVDLSHHSKEVLSYLEDADIYRHPSVKVILFGSDEAHATNITTHQSLRNVINLLYLEQLLYSGPSGVKVYNRCLYCNKSNKGLTKLCHGYNKCKLLTPQTLFPDQFSNMHGHEIRIVTKGYGPLIRISPPIIPGGTLVNPLDSQDTKIIAAMANALNFTYSVRLPADNEWGRVLPSGKFSGVVGTVQQQEADISFSITFMPARAKAVDSTQVFGEDPLVIVTAKPLPLSPVLAIVRPLPHTMYIILLVLVVTMTLLFWGFSTLESPLIGVENITPFKSFHITFGILLEEVPPQKPNDGGSAFLLITWLLFSLIVTTLYKSSLKANLIIPMMSQTINSLDDLAQSNFTCGMAPFYGSVYQWMKTSDVSTVKTVSNRLEILPFEENLDKAVSSDHAYMYLKIYVYDIVAKERTDSTGSHPFHMAQTNDFPFLNMVWGARQGAPFLGRFSDMIQRLVATGLTDHWLKKSSEETIRNTRIRKREEEKDGESTKSLSNETVLTVEHLQGPFYILLIGFLLSALALMGEISMGKITRGAVDKADQFTTRTNGNNDLTGAGLKRKWTNLQEE